MTNEEIINQYKVLEAHKAEERIQSRKPLWFVFGLFIVWTIISNAYDEYVFDSVTSSPEYKQVVHNAQRVLDICKETRLARANIIDMIVAEGGVCGAEEARVKEVRSDQFIHNFE